MAAREISKLLFTTVYPLYVQKAERKGRTREEVDQVIRWLTGYSEVGLQQQIDKQSTFETFFAEAPGIHPNSALIRGVVCGVRVEDVEGGNGVDGGGRGSSSYVARTSPDDLKNSSGCRRFGRSGDETGLGHLHCVCGRVAGD